MSEMKFNGEVWMMIPNTSTAQDEPAKFVLVKNPKFGGGIIPYVKWRNGEWSANPVPNRVLIRELAIALEQTINAVSIAENSQSSGNEALDELLRKYGKDLFHRKNFC